MAAGRLIIPGWARALDSDGDPISAAVSLFDTGTDNLATVYANEALNVPLANPVESNSAGRFPAIWADDSVTYDWSVVADYGPPGSPFTGTGLTTASSAATLNAAVAEAAADEAEASAAAAEGFYQDALAIQASGDDAAAIAARVSTAALAASGGSALVGTIASGTGAVLRTQQAKNRDYVSIKDFGAVCDGVTNDTVAIHAAMAAASHVLVPGHTKANITWPRSGVRLYGDEVGEFSQTLFTYRNGSLIEAFDPAQPVITINPDTAGENLESITIENLMIAGVGRQGHGIVIQDTTGAKKVTNINLKGSVITRSCDIGFKVDCEVLWLNADNLTHEFCKDGASIVSDKTCNGWTIGSWTARRNQRHGIEIEKTDVSISGHQAWDIGLLSADYNGVFSDTGVAYTGVKGLRLKGTEGFKFGQMVLEGNGMTQPSDDSYGLLIEGTCNRAIEISGGAVTDSKFPIRWTGSGGSGKIDNLYRLSSTDSTTGLYITSEYSNTGGAKIELGPNINGTIAVDFDGNANYPTFPGMDYDSVNDNELRVRNVKVKTINTSVLSASFDTLSGKLPGETITLFNFAGGTANTVTVQAGLMFDGVANVIPANTARSFVVIGFPNAGKLAAL